GRGVRGVVVTGRPRALLHLRRPVTTSSRLRPGVWVSTRTSSNPMARQRSAKQDETLMATPKLPFTGDPEADGLLEREPLALLIAILLDQQVPMEKAFHSPYDLKHRLGDRLDAGHIAARDPDGPKDVFRSRPAPHRF